MMKHMIMTKKDITAKLNLAINLEQEIKKLLVSVYDDLSNEEDLSCNKFLSNVARSVGESDNTTYALGMLKDSVSLSKELESLEEGSEFIIPQITIDKNYPENVELSFHTDNGNLLAYTSSSDDNTPQTGTMMRMKNGSVIDLSLSEIKKGALAEAHNLPADNNDVDIYVWKDPLSEDYSEMYRIKNEDIEKALEEDLCNCEYE